MQADAYQYREIRRSPQGRAVACFAVESATGQYREELLALPLVEARIHLWFEQSRPAQRRAAALAVYEQANYREYVRALLDAIRCGMLR